MRVDYPLVNLSSSHVILMTVKGSNKTRAREMVHTQNAWEECVRISLHSPPNLKICLFFEEREANFKNYDKAKLLQ